MAKKSEGSYLLLAKKSEGSYLSFCVTHGETNVSGKHIQGNHITKMGADKSAKNIPNTPKFTCPNCLPKHKSLGFL
jgi:hypothetical protein